MCTLNPQCSWLSRETHVLGDDTPSSTAAWWEHLANAPHPVPRISCSLLVPPTHHLWGPVCILQLYISRTSAWYICGRLTFPSCPREDLSKKCQQQFVYHHQMDLFVFPITNALNRHFNSKWHTVLRIQTYNLPVIS